MKVKNEILQDLLTFPGLHMKVQPGVKKKPLSAKKIQEGSNAVIRTIWTVNFYLDNLVVGAVFDSWPSHNFLLFHAILVQSG
jgi:hypothetical protein